MVNISQVF